MEDMADLKTQFIVTMNQGNPDCAIIAHLQKKTFMERMLENHLHVQPVFPLRIFAVGQFVFLSKLLAHSERSERSGAERITAWGPGARLRAPVGSRGKAPGGGPGGSAPGSSRFLAF